MCGIYGSTILYNQQQVKEKLARTNFRGPDQSGFEYFNERVLFGHNRLSIIDLDPRSNQPFTYEYVHMVFNGEIFNFLDLKETLSKKGYSFKTTSDTEVVCAAYLEYGQEFVKHLNGMFALVIYDTKKNILFGARDRLGQKPLYYYHNGKNFEFASQISSIQLHHKELTISSNAIGHYLAWGNVPDPMSIFNEVKKLKPGHSFIFNLESGDFNIKEYWDIDISAKASNQLKYPDAVEALDELLTDATKIRLFADVPVGVFLSGGIDSSLIAALATKSTSEKVKTFSVKFNEQAFDESGYARQVADHLNTEHHEIQCNTNEGLDLIDNFSRYYDEPFADSSAIPSMILAKHTKKHVTVALSGDAGDENFIGYSRYQNNRNKKLYNIPFALRYPIGKALQWSPNYKSKVIAKALQLRSFDDYYLNSFIGIDHGWLDIDFNPLNIPERKYLEHTNKDKFERMANFDLKTYLNWDINTKVDRASMAFSLEARSPIMDYRVVEFANALPSHYKMQGNNQKRILKDVLYKYLPKDIFDRPKSGFTMPFAEWFRHELKDYVLSELSIEELKSIPMINANKVDFRVQQHMSGTWNRFPLIWKLLVLKQWLKINGQSHTIV